MCRLPLPWLLAVVGIAAVCTLPPTSRAAVLGWDRTDVSIQADPLAESVEAVYTFTNTSGAPITIAGAHSSCGCTVPSLEKNTYAPGETGRIRAVFTIGERTGTQEKTITVTTAEPSASMTTLVLRVQIPKLFEVSPYFVVWSNGETPAAKAIDLRVLLPDHIAVKSVESRHANFTATLEPAGDEPGHFRVLVTPSATDTAVNGAIVVTLATPKGETRSVNLYALVRASPPPATPPVAPGTKPVASHPEPGR